MKISNKNKWPLYIIVVLFCSLFIKDQESLFVNAAAKYRAYVAP